MSDVARLLEAFERGDLLRPTPDRPNLVDLANALATRAGVDDLELTPGARELAAAIGPAEHLVFILADGLGATLLEGEPGAAFLGGHVSRELMSTFPSTTAVALTSLATGAWPAHHSISGWWSYLPVLGDVVTVLPYERRQDERPLAALGVTPQQLFPLPSLWRRAARDVRCIQPGRIAGSVYSRYANGGRGCEGYGSLADAFELLATRLEEATAPAYTYLYLPHIDAAAHEYGLESPEVHGALMALDRQVARLAEALPPGTRVVLAADHGHLTVPDERRHRIRYNDALAALLATLPAGDLRVVSFRVQPGREDRFAAAFHARFGARFVLLTIAEVESLELLGPGPLAAETRARLGDFVAISLGVDILAYLGENGHRHVLMQSSHHSGLTPDELRVPLVLL